MFDHLVIGAGEVGRALFNVLSDGDWSVGLKDLEILDAPADMLHICYPYDEDFAHETRHYVRHHEARVVVVHSTVKPGTCDAEGWNHSPVRGRHPDLEKSLRTFIKPVGGPDSTEVAESVYGPLDLAYTTWPRALECEVGKVFELVQYGVQIQVQREIFRVCNEMGADPEVVYTQFAHEYNHGYDRLSMWQFIRPVIEDMPGPIGGHCVVQNAGLVDSPLSRIVTQGFDS